jgi:hypothetical protein
MSRNELFVLDSDVFITAKNRYYAFAICPGFWDSLIYHAEAEDLCSIDKVRSELVSGRETEDLVVWAKEAVPDEFFKGTDEQDVANAYGQVMLWAQRNTQYVDQAKAKFATGADGWLVAYAMVHGATVVTNEQPRPNARSDIKLPDVCSQFNVAYKDTFLMLNELAVKYEWRAPD